MHCRFCRLVEMAELEALLPSITAALQQTTKKMLEQFTEFMEQETKRRQEQREQQEKSKTYVLYVDSFTERELVDPADDEYGDIVNKFKDTPYKVHKIEQLLNSSFSERFRWKRDEFEAAGKSTDDLMLFHGCPSLSAIENIIEYNFDLDAEPVNGRKFGDGIYFGDLDVAANYSGDTGLVLYCKVLTGKMANGTGGVKKNYVEDGYDSSIMIKSDRGVHALVVSDVDMILPKFLVHFSTDQVKKREAEVKKREEKYLRAKLSRKLKRTRKRNARNL